MRMSRHRILTIGMIGAASLLAAACGSSSTTSKVSSSNTALTAPKRCNGQTVTWQLGYFPQAEFAGMLYAIKQGYFADEGIKLHLLVGGPLVNGIANLSNGTADMGDSDMLNTMDAAAKGAPLIQVAQVWQTDPSREIALRSSGIRTLSDLKGKTVGIELVGPQPDLEAMLGSVGLKINDIHQQNIGFSLVDLLNHKVQAAPLFAFFHIAELEDAGYHYPQQFTVFNPNTLGTAAYIGVIAANSDWASAHPNLVVCTLAALQRGWKEAEANPTQALSDDMTFVPKGVSTSHDQRIDMRYTFQLVDPAKMLIDQATMSKVRDIAVKYTGLPSSFSLAKAYTNEYMQAAYKLSSP